jgi:site-specific recombinase XerD
MKLLDQVRHLLRAKHYSYRTEQCYLAWIEQYVRFCRTPEGFRHPATLGAPEVEQFLTHLAVTRHVSASTQNQVLNALLFLYRDVLRLDLGSQELLGHQDVSTTMICTHVAAQGPAGVRSPLDALGPPAPPQPAPVG